MEKEQATQVPQIVRDVLEEITTVTLAMQETEHKAASGTRLAQRVGIALESIFSVVERQASEIETTNQVANQHLQSSMLVVQIMQEVAHSAQQSSESTREAARQMEYLAQLAGQLHSSVEVFKLREERCQPQVAPGPHMPRVEGKQPDQFVGQRPESIRLLKGAGEHPSSDPSSRQPR